MIWLECALFTLFLELKRGFRSWKNKTSWTSDRLQKVINLIFSKFLFFGLLEFCICSLNCPSSEGLEKFWDASAHYFYSPSQRLDSSYLVLEWLEKFVLWEFFCNTAGKVGHLIQQPCLYCIWTLVSYYGSPYFKVRELW